MKICVLPGVLLWGFVAQLGLGQGQKDAANLVLPRASAPAAGLPAAEAGWADFLGKVQERIPPCSVEWKVSRELPGNAEMADSMGKDFDQRIADARSERERELLIKNKASLMASVGNPQVIPLTIKLDYLSPKRFYIFQSFDYPGRPVTYEVYADGDGIIYVENQNNRRVRLLPDSATILDELARGLPEVVLSRTLGIPKSVKTTEDTPEAAELEVVSGVRRGTVRLWIDKATLQVTKWEEGYAPASGVFSAQRQVQTDRISIQSGYPIPDEVVFTQFNGRDKVGMRETWMLVKFELRADAALMHTTKHVFKPGYHGVDETGPKPRRFEPQAKEPKDP